MEAFEMLLSSPYQAIYQRAAVSHSFDDLPGIFRNGFTFINWTNQNIGNTEFDLRLFDWAAKTRWYKEFIIFLMLIIYTFCNFVTLSLRGQKMSLIPSRLKNLESVYHYG